LFTNGADSKGRIVQKTKVIIQTTVEMAALISKGKYCESVVGSVACSFPNIRTAAEATKRRMSSRVILDHLQDISKLREGQETASCVLQAAWALVLHYYTRSEEVWFGYDEVDVDASVAETPEPSGPSSGTSAVRLLIQDGMSLAEVVEQTKGKFSLVEQNVSPRGTGNCAPSLYNTAVMFRVRRAPLSAPNAATFVQPQVGIALPEEVRGVCADLTKFILRTHAVQGSSSSQVSRGLP
jgi:hypothetical protein